MQVSLSASTKNPSTDSRPGCQAEARLGWSPSGPREWAGVAPTSLLAARSGKGAQADIIQCLLWTVKMREKNQFKDSRDVWPLSPGEASERTSYLATDAIQLYEPRLLLVAASWIESGSCGTLHLIQTSRHLETSIHKPQEPRRRAR